MVLFSDFSDEYFLSYDLFKAKFEFKIGISSTFNQFHFSLQQLKILYYLNAR